MMKKLLVLVIALILIEGALAANYNGGMRNIKRAISEERQKGLRIGNEPFVMGSESDRAGIILFHGFTASPWEVKELAQYLNNDNITIYSPLLAGHGTSPRDLKKTKWEEWHSMADEDFRTMRSMFDCVYVGGMSTGASLALMIAAEHDVCGIVSIGAPVFFQDWKAKYTWLFKYILPYTTRKLPDDLKPYYYEKRPTAAVAELIEMIEAMKEGLPKIDEPIFIVQSLKDQTVKPESAQFIMTNVSSLDRTFIWFDEGQHVIIKDNQREEVFRLISEFIHEQEDKRDRLNIRNN